MILKLFTMVRGMITLLNRRRIPKPVDPKIVIPVGATQDESDAAAMIQHHIERVSGVVYPIQAEDSIPDNSSWCIFVGDTTLSSGVSHGDLDVWGCSVSRSRTSVFIRAGSNPRAIRGAAGKYLERIGIRQWGPWDLWCSTSRRLHPFLVRSWSQVPDVGLLRQGGTDRFGTAGWADAVGAMRSDINPTVHTWGDVLSLQSFVDYPNIQPTYNGEDFIPTAQQFASRSGWQPCMYYTNDLADAIEPGCRAYLDANGEKFLPITVNDGGNPCDCPECVAADASAGSLGRNRTDQHHALLNEMVSRLRSGYPDLVVLGLDYWPTNEDPVLLLEPEIAIQQFFTLDSGVMYRPLRAIYDWTHGWKQLIPDLKTRAIENRARTTLGDVTDSWVVEAFTSHGHQLAQPYITARLAWDLTADVDALWSRWAADLFPHARAEIIAYKDALEALWSSYDGRYPRLNRIGQQLDIRAEQVAAIAVADSALMACLAVDGLMADEQARLNVIANSWHVTKTLALWTAAELEPEQSEVDAFRAHIDTNIIPDPQTLFRFDADGSDLAEWLDGAIEYATIKTSQWDDWTTILHRVNGPIPSGFIPVDTIPSGAWLAEWTVTRGNQDPNRNWFHFKQDRRVATVGFNSPAAQLWFWSSTEYLGSTAVNAGPGDSLRMMFVYDPADRWRVFVDGHQVMSGDAADVLTTTPEAFGINLLGDEASADAVFRAEP